MLDIAFKIRLHGTDHCWLPLHIGALGQTKLGPLVVNSGGAQTGITSWFGDLYTNQQNYGLRVHDTDGFCYRINTIFGVIVSTRVDCTTGNASSSTSVPSAPQNLLAIPGATTITLSWFPSFSKGGSSISYYRLYRGTITGGPYSPAINIGDVLNYVDSNIIQGIRYYYRVTAVNVTGEGPRSNETNAQAGAPPPSPKIFFTSGQTYNGNLGGLVGADSKCQTLADARGLSGTFKAWLSSSVVSATSRLTHSTSAYVLVTGTVIANGWSQLASGQLAGEPNRTEDGILLDPAVNPPNYVWTNTNGDGNIFTSYTNDTCDDWTTNGIARSGRVGLTYGTAAQWTNATIGLCTSAYRLYCIQQ